jgi:hypothetical protein
MVTKPYLFNSFYATPLQTAILLLLFWSERTETAVQMNSSPLLWAQQAFYPVGVGGKTVGEWNWPLASNYCQGQENVDLYIHSPIRLRGIVLN